MGNEIHLDKNVAVANKDENEANYCGAKNHKADEDEVINMRCEEAKGIFKASENMQSGMFSFKKSVFFVKKIRGIPGIRYLHLRHFACETDCYMYVNFVLGQYFID